MILHFNSIKVRLERSADGSNINANHHFNSIKVRLELKKTAHKKTFIRFQFHKGTIRTLSRQTISNYIEQFQFHKGTIRTRISPQTAKS